MPCATRSTPILTLKMGSEDSTSSAPVLLDARNVDVRFPLIERELHAVKNVSLTLERGTTIALVGESGSGKSITARAIMRMLPEKAITSQEMRISLDGQDLAELDLLAMERVRGNRITMIFQEPMTSLNPLFTIGFQLCEIIIAHNPKIKKKAAMKRSLELLREVHIPSPEARLRQYPHQMSGGQRQRVMIAMGIANKPDLLIADEPTTALDVTVQAQILGLLAELQSKYGMAILLITHDLTVVRQVAKKVNVMRQGEIVERGTTEEIFTNPQHPYTQKLLASEPSGKPDPMVGAHKTIVRASRIKKRYELTTGSFFKRVKTELMAVNDVSIEVKEGETLGVVGESGSGKTTLGMSIIRLLAPTSGEIHFDGERIDKLDSMQMLPYRPRIQVVFQDPFSSLNPRMIVRQIIAEGLIVNNMVSSSSELNDRVAKALTEVQLDPEVMDRFPHEFSGGQRQRIAIARMIAMNPEFVLLDEPTSALDLSIQAQIIDMLRELRAKHKLSYLFISHDLKVVRALCHRIIVMQNGVVVETGTTDEVLENPKQEYTAQLVDASFKVISQKKKAA